MASFLGDITNGGATPALAHTLSFTEARMKMIAENVANIHTPGYRTKTLDMEGFQGALRRALDEKGADGSKPLAMKSGDQVRTRSDGRLLVKPSVRPVENVLFHDGTNQSVERQMAELARTGMTHDLAVALLKDRFDRLQTAIRGTM